MLLDANSPLKTWLPIAFFVYLLTPFFSTGFHHYDEHFCVLEYAAQKMDLAPVEDLNRDFRIQMRPWIPAAVTYLLAATLNAGGATDPWVWAAFVRLLSSLLGWFCLWILYEASLRWIHNQNARRWLLAMSALIWFLPYIRAHASQESWGGSFFFIGFGLLFIQRKSIPARDFLVGALWGLAFQSRFQMGIMIAGIGLWCLLVGKVGVLRISKFAGGFLALQAIALLVDYWGYGVWTLPAWNYLRWQVFEGGANQAGVDPWWYYLRVIFQAGFPFGILLAVTTCMTWLRFPRNPITWVTLPFFVIHLFLGHKEMRYLFPLAPAVPLLLILPLEKFFAVAWSKWVRVGVTALVAINFLYLLVVVFRPLRTELALYREVYNRKLTDIYFNGYNPYVMADVRAHFYRRPGLRLHEVGDAQEFRKSLGVEPRWIFLEGMEIPDDWKSLSSNCRLEFQSVPKFLRGEKFRPLWKRVRVRVMSLYSCISG